MQNKQNNAQAIAEGSTSLGIELGSTRIKAVLIGPDHDVLASGAYDWENRLVDGYWTYDLYDVWGGIQSCYQKLSAAVTETYGVPLKTFGAIGVSAMMHGYLPFDAEGRQLAPFRTWRNTTTQRSAEALSDLFSFNIPQRWSIAHLYQAILDGEAHAKDISYLTTLSGYVHWMLTGEKVLGVGDASGMFPIDSATNDYHAGMAQAFDDLLEKQGLPYHLKSIFPKVLPAGARAGTLTPEGALLLDPSGTLSSGIPLCPPEGDAGTGMVATNSVSPRSGNISAGTSVFAMIVLEQPLSRAYPEIDLVTTPAGSPVAMVHCNTCTSDLDAWVRLLGETLQAAGSPLPKPKLYDLFYEKALEGDADGGGLVSYNYYAGEPITGLSAGRPLFMRRPDAKFTLANFARVQLYSTIATLAIGMDILLKQERVQLDVLLGHGGLFKTPVVGQRLLAGALRTPVAVLKTAGEGGPWGMALLAQYMQNPEGKQSLGAFLADCVFAGETGSTIAPDQADSEGFARFLVDYRSGLAAEAAAVEALKD